MSSSSGAALPYDRDIDQSDPTSEVSPTPNPVPLAGSEVRRGFLPCDRVTCMALAMTVAGWGLIWASGLPLIKLIPVWLGTSVFFAGLALIPFRTRSGRNRQ
ncbi:MAG: hypothetical protein JO007_16275 [Alphaproteobacteria bacterium]|nr:hypothetical protein [Alphaproteobacteria bacterium]